MAYLTEYWNIVKHEHKCPKCKGENCLVYKLWGSASTGHEDYHYRCTKCEAKWWVDGADY